MLLINRELAKLKNDTKCTFLSKLIKLVKKPSNLTRIGKKKLYCPISHFLAYFVELVGWLCFCFVEGLMGLIDGLAMGRAKLRRREVAIGFSR